MNLNKFCFIIFTFLFLLKPHSAFSVDSTFAKLGMEIGLVQAKGDQYEVADFGVKKARESFDTSVGVLVSLSHGDTKTAFQKALKPLVQSAKENITNHVENKIFHNRDIKRERDLAVSNYLSHLTEIGKINKQGLLQGNNIEELVKNAQLYDFIRQQVFSSNLSPEEQRVFQYYTVGIFEKNMISNQAGLKLDIAKVLTEIYSLSKTINQDMVRNNKNLITQIESVVQKEVEGVSKQLTEYQGYLMSAFEGERKRQESARKTAEIQENLNASTQILYAALYFISPKEAKRITETVQHIMTIGTAVNKILDGGTQGACLGPYGAIAGATMGLISTFMSSGPSEMQILSSQISQLTKLLEIVRKEMHERFDILEESLAKTERNIIQTLNKNFQLINKEIAILKTTVKRLEDKTDKIWDYDQKNGLYSLVKDYNQSCSDVDVCKTSIEVSELKEALKNIDSYVSNEVCQTPLSMSLIINKNKAKKLVLGPHWDNKEVGAVSEEFVGFKYHDVSKMSEYEQLFVPLMESFQSEGMITELRNPYEFVKGVMSYSKFYLRWVRDGYQSLYQMEQGKKRLATKDEIKTFFTENYEERMRKYRGFANEILGNIEQAASYRSSIGNLTFPAEKLMDYKQAIQEIPPRFRSEYVKVLRKTLNLDEMDDNFNKELKQITDVVANAKEKVTCYFQDDEVSLKYKNNSYKMRDCNYKYNSFRNKKIKEIEERRKLAEDGNKALSDIYGDSKNMMVVLQYPVKWGKESRDGKPLDIILDWKDLSYFFSEKDLQLINKAERLNLGKLIGMYYISSNDENISRIPGPIREIPSDDNILIVSFTWRNYSFEKRHVPEDVFILDDHMKITSSKRGNFVMERRREMGLCGQRMMHGFLMNDFACTISSYEMDKKIENRKSNTLDAMRKIGVMVNETEINYNNKVANIVHDIFWQEDGQRLNDFSHRIDGAQVLINAYDYFVLNQSYKFDPTFIKAHEKILSAYQLSSRLNQNIGDRGDGYIDGYKVEDFIHNLDLRIATYGNMLESIKRLINERVEGYASKEKYQFITDFKKHILEEEDFSVNEESQTSFPFLQTIDKFISKEEKIWEYPYKKVDKDVIQLTPHRTEDNYKLEFYCSKKKNLTPGVWVEIEDKLVNEYGHGFYYSKTLDTIHFSPSFREYREAVRSSFFNCIDLNGIFFEHAEKNELTLAPY